MRTYYVYIMASRSGTLYIGMTNDLTRRVYEHKHRLVKGFTSRYRVTRLVYLEETNQVGAAIAREKELKGWLRAKKIALVESANPEWRDLSKGWFGRVMSNATEITPRKIDARSFASLKMTAIEWRPK